MKNLHILKGLIIALFLFPFFGKAQDKRPNILFIMSDDHTSQAWGIYGGVLKDYVPNTNIKRLAEEGTVLNNALCTNSICVPSRATILTGQYSHKNQVYTLDDALDPDRENVAKLLQKSGYQTAIIGKWHLKKKPSGFDYFKVLPGHGVYHNPSFLTNENWNDNESNGEVNKGFCEDLITDFSLDWIKKRDVTKPFFLMCHFKATHEPFEFADRFKDLYKNVEFPYPSSYNDWGKATTGRTFEGQKLEELGNRYEKASQGSFWTSYPDLPFSTKNLDAVAARNKIYQKFIKDYLRCAAGIDDNLGKILDYLKASGLDENTVVIYTSDQGYFLGEHAFFDKRLMYEESLRMPFVICYPKEVKQGKRIDDIILNIDFPSLFLDYAGVKQPETMQGMSFRENLKESKIHNWRKSMYYRYWTNDVERPAHFGIRDSRYKLILFYGQDRLATKRDNMPMEPSWEFYDLKKDPNEIHNAILDSEYKKIIGKMKKELIKLRKQYDDTDEDNPIIKDLVKNSLK